MKGITIYHKNENELQEEALSSISTNLLSEVDFTIYNAPNNTIAWLTPAAKSGETEIFNVVSGTIQLALDEGNVIVSAGEGFKMTDLEHDVEIKVLENAKILYVVNKDTLSNTVDAQSKLNDLLMKIDEKDAYTYSHSLNVMKYSGAILKYLDPQSKSYNDLMLAALFHDVGKCMIPDEILTKNSRLDDEERKIMIKHPIYSGRLLKPLFGEKIAEMAKCHHERLDGSGYPYNLSGDEVSLECRILAVADSFDAMTTKRVYRNNTKSFLEAAEELYNMPEIYDNEVAKALLELVKTNQI